MSHAHRPGYGCVRLRGQPWGAPDMPELLEQADAPVVLARGEHDRLVTHEQLATLVPDPVTLFGLGHNAHVEDPAAVIGMLGRVAF